MFYSSALWTFLESPLSLGVTCPTFLSRELKKKSSFDFQAGLCAVPARLFIPAGTMGDLGAAGGGLSPGLVPPHPRPLLLPALPEPAQPWPRVGHGTNHKQSHSAQGSADSASKGGER